MSANSSYRDAVLEDGCFIMGHAVAILYRGENLRPDVYFRLDSKLRRKNYNGIFNNDQRQRIEQSGLAENYDIASGVRFFDVSLLVLLAEHTCGLTAGEPLLQKITELRDLRNRVSHPSEALATMEISEENLCSKLQELLTLYLGIMNSVEMKTSKDQYAVMMEIRGKLLQRVPQRLRPTANASGPARLATTSKSEEEMPTWGKVALGVTVGAAALGVGALAWNAGNKSRSKGEPRRIQAQRQKADECILM